MNKDDDAAHFLKKLLPEREDMKFLFVISCRLRGAIHLEASCPVMEASKESSRASKESSRDVLLGGLNIRLSLYLKN